MPLGVNTDLGDLFSKEGVEKLKNFASSFTKDGTSSKVGLRVKPSLSVGSTQVPFPNYITLEKKTGSSSTTNNSTSTNTTTTPTTKKGRI